jgi:hypothetical protein
MLTVLGLGYGIQPPCPDLASCMQIHCAALTISCLGVGAFDGDFSKGACADYESCYCGCSSLACQANCDNSHGICMTCTDSIVSCEERECGAEYRACLAMQ